MDWQEPPAEALPTGGDLYDAYLRPLSETPELVAVVETGARVKPFHGAAWTRLSAAGAAISLLRLQLRVAIEVRASISPGQ